MLGIEQYRSPHDQGSSHGETRITRQAYFEDPLYVQIAKRSQAMYRELEKESGERLYDQIGAVYMGRPDSVLLRGVRESIRVHGLEHKVYDAAGARAQFPFLRLASDNEVIYEPNAGILYPEKCIRAHLTLAQRSAHAKVLELTRYFGFEEQGAGLPLRVKTDNGVFLARKLVLANGMGISQELQRLRVPYKIVKQSISWFKLDSEFARPDRLPIFMGENDKQEHIYGFPNLEGRGLKTSIHHFGDHFNTYFDAHNINRDFNQQILQQTKTFVRSLFDVPSDFGVLKTSTCFYTILPDEHFLIDFHPQNKNVVLVSCCSGHGFKFSSALGQEIVDMLATNEPPY